MTTILSGITFGAVVAGLYLYIRYFYLEDTKDLQDFED